MSSLSSEHTQTEWIFLFCRSLPQLALIYSHILSMYKPRRALILLKLKAHMPCHRLPQASLFCRTSSGNRWFIRYEADISGQAFLFATISTECDNFIFLLGFPIYSRSKTERCQFLWQMLGSWF